MKKFTESDLDDVIDFSGTPHAVRGLSVRGYCRCDSCIEGRTEIAESLSMDGTEVKGVFAVDERKTLKEIAVRYIESEVYGVR